MICQKPPQWVIYRYSILNLTYYSHQSSRFICNNTAAFLIMLLWNWKTTLYFLTCK